MNGNEMKAEQGAAPEASSAAVAVDLKTIHEDVWKLLVDSHATDLRPAVITSQEMEARQLTVQEVQDAFGAELAKCRKKHEDEVAADRAKRAEKKEKEAARDRRPDASVTAEMLGTHQSVPCRLCKGFHKPMAWGTLVFDKESKKYVAKTVTKKFKTGTGFEEKEVPVLEGNFFGMPLENGEKGPFFTIALLCPDRKEKGKFVKGCASKYMDALPRDQKGFLPHEMKKLCGRTYGDLAEIQRMMTISQGVAEKEARAAEERKRDDDIAQKAKVAAKAAVAMAQKNPARFMRDSGKLR